MPSRNLLVVLMDAESPAALREAIGRRADDRTNVHVVAPIRQSTLQWLATDEDEARAEADVRALEAEWILSDEAAVDSEAGDVDPVQAVEDALREFPADEILLLGGPETDGGLEASLRGLGLPVRRPGGSLPLQRGDRFREGVRRIVAGRSRATPFVFFAGVNLALLALALLISLVVLLVLWLG